jgi:MFS superfamily sulfate permease-like transporter
VKEQGNPPGRPGSLVRWVPVASRLPRYQRGWLAGDAIAGFTIWGLLIPEMIAYASLAGLVIFSEALGAVQTFADRHGYRLNSSQEMIALGLANWARGCSAGWPAGGACPSRRSTRAPGRAPRCRRSSPVRS